jgi:hypothetical protein
MNTKRFHYAFLCLALQCGAHAATEGERIEYNESTGNYIIWEVVDGKATPNTFIPANKFTPHISVELRHDSGGFRYTYTVGNSIHSEQQIELLFFDTPNLKNLYVDASEWISKTLPDARHNGQRAGVLYWGDEIGGIEPGDSLSFSSTSDKLAGVGPIYIQGATPAMSFHGYGIGPELEDEYRKLTAPKNNSIKQYTIIPALNATADDDNATILRNMIAHTIKLRDNGLIDKGFSERLITNLKKLLNASRKDGSNDLPKLLTKTLAFLSTEKPGPLYNKVTKTLTNAYRFNLTYILSRTDKNRTQNR